MSMFSFLCLNLQFFLGRLLFIRRAELSLLPISVACIVLGFFCLTFLVLKAFLIRKASLEFSKIFYSQSFLFFKAFLQFKKLFSSWSLFLSSPSFFIRKALCLEFFLIHITSSTVWAFLSQSFFCSQIFSSEIFFWILKKARFFQNFNWNRFLNVVFIRPRETIFQNSQ